MTMSQSCSWCHHMNTLVAGVKILCRHCGHRADLSRLDCDCPQCWSLFSVPKPPLTDGELSAAIAAAVQHFTGGAT